MRRCLSLLCLLLAACSSSAPVLPQWQATEGLEHSEVGRIVDLRTGQAIDPRLLVERLAPAERVIVGERHDNPDHHSLQLWLLQALAHERAQGSVLLEMIVPAQQARVDQARADLARGDRPADLPARLDWSEGWPWNLYGSLVSYALAQPYPLLAANLDRSEIVELYRSPVPIPGRASSRRAVIEALTAQIVQSHCGMLPDTQVPAMVGIQQQRDRRMAERLLAAPAPALLLAGGFHARRDVGVPLHIADLGGPAPLVVMLAEVGEPVEPWQADFVWFTPGLPEQDHCAGFKAAADGGKP
ncbi:ChaN family lipoprotein [Stutzerimonas balearica]|uniref:ChaN family lipoprotein n=1 Tax=Stutzerimonas balearica TaxID=74829 RepID=UPI00289910E5|nr:ChaN family lipoprotein [Stutzerimonas balearica]